VELAGPTTLVALVVVTVVDDVAALVEI